MKKTLLAGLTLALLASLATAACGKKEEPAAPKAPAAASHEPSSPAAAIPGTAAPGAAVPAPPAEAIAGKSAPADAVHAGAAGQTANPHAGLPTQQVPPGTGRKGKVVETMNASSYTYIKVDENGKGVWLAVMQQPIKVGQTIEFPNVPPMVNFTSKTLNRTFDAILFVPSIRVE